MDPTFNMTHLNIGITYLRQGKYEKALEEFEREREVSTPSDLTSEVVIAATHGLLGMK
ncbi:hypothetical protein GWN19_03910, partial [Candidatus Bathyarchaeota archaeon]|nr:hypothetical protein [Candidatus Bathyarchaeota archaeon]